MYDIPNMSTDDLRNLVGLIRENIAECGRNSSYAKRNQPVLNRAIVELGQRGAL